MVHPRCIGVAYLKDYSGNEHEIRFYRRPFSFGLLSYSVRDPDDTWSGHLFVPWGLSRSRAIDMVIKNYKKTWTPQQRAA